MLGTNDNHLTFPAEAPATGPLGRTLGMVSLAVLFGFLAAAWGIWQQTTWWPVTLISSAVVALPIAFVVWNPVGVVTVPATAANLALVAATLMAWGERFLGVH